MDGTGEIHSEGENKYEYKWCRALNYDKDETRGHLDPLLRILGTLVKD
jgi:hypothetical protein